MSNNPYLLHGDELARTEAARKTGATPKPRAGEQFRRTPDVIAQLEAEKAALRDRFETLIATADRLITERDLLRERERELVEVMRALTQVGTIDGNVVVGPRGWELVQAALKKVKS